MTDILTAAPSADSFENNTYEPRRSTRINANLNTPADGDTWEEKLVVCEASSNKLVIRSYFRNIRTRKRVWDEPPTGASHIEPATASMRHDAEEELKNLQLAINNGPSLDAVKKGKSSSTSSKKGKGLFSAFRKKPKEKDGSGSNGKGGGGLFGNKKNKKTAAATATTKATAVGPVDTPDEDEDMQRALAASMGLEVPEKSSQKKSAGGGNNKKSHWNEEQEALDMAKAISMSEASVPASSEEEMLQRAIEASRAEMTASSMPASGIASMPASMPDFLSEDFSERLTPQAAFESHDSDSSFFNTKMPAQPTPFLALPTETRGAPLPAVAVGAAPYATGASLKPPPAAESKAFSPSSASLKPPPRPTAPGLKPTPTAAATAPSFDFDPFAKNPHPTPAATFPTQFHQPMEDSGLRKMEGDDGNRKGLGIRMYKKKSVQVQAGVV